MPLDEEKIEAGVRLILEGIGDDPDREGVKDTPRRVADMYREIFAGIDVDATPIASVVPGADFDEMIMVKDIPLYSVCEHHLLPWVGTAHVAYIPNKDGRITGLSKIARVVDTISKRPQVQERLTTDVADALEKALEPRGVFVLIEAEHLCMTMRGIKKPGSRSGRASSLRPRPIRRSARSSSTIPRWNGVPSLRSTRIPSIERRSSVVSSPREPAIAAWNRCDWARKNGPIAPGGASSASRRISSATDTSVAASAASRASTKAHWIMSWYKPRDST